MKWLTFILIPPLLSLSPVPAGAGESESPSFTLEAALARGLENSPALRAAYERYQAALQKEPQARSLPDPQVSFTHFVCQVQTRTGPSENVYMVSQTLPWFGKLKLKAEAASHEARAAHFAYEAARLKLFREIGRNYWEYAYLAERTRLVDESLDLLDRLKEVVNERVRTGGSAQERLRLELETGRLDNVKTGLAAERVKLNAALLASMGKAGAGADLLPWPKLNDAVPAGKDASVLAGEVSERHPALKALDLQRQAAEARLRLAKKSAIPDPTIGATVNEIGDNGENAVGFTVGFKIPLWGKKYRAERAEAEAMERAVLAEREETALRLEEELAAAVKMLESASERATRYRDELLPTARELIEVSETSYAGGKLSLLDLIDAERALLETEQSYWRAMADAQQALVILDTLSVNLPES